MACIRFGFLMVCSFSFPFGYGRFFWPMLFLFWKVCFCLVPILMFDFNFFLFIPTECQMYWIRNKKLTLKLPRGGGAKLRRIFLPLFKILFLNFVNIFVPKLHMQYDHMIGGNTLTQKVPNSPQDEGRVVK